MIKVTQEISIREFKGWSGGADTLQRVWDEGKIDELDNLLQEMYPEGTEVDETDLNDLLWFHRDMIYLALGIED